MTEAEWLECTDPQMMLNFLKGNASDRRLRLFTVACCRRICHLVTNQQLREGVDILERYADRQTPYREMVWAAKAAERVGWSLPGETRALSDAVWAATAMNVQYWFRPVWRTVRTVRHLLVFDKHQAASQTALLRCIFGNHFQQLMLDQTWLMQPVLTIAQTIYDDRAFDRLPILANALEDAGCDNADLLTHCRSGGEHVRGCWVIDLLLGKS